MTNATDTDNRPLDEVERLRAAQVEALKRENAMLRDACEAALTIEHYSDWYNDALWNRVHAALRNHEPEAKERP